MKPADQCLFRWDELNRTVWLLGSVKRLHGFHAVVEHNGMEYAVHQDDVDVAVEVSADAVRFASGRVLLSGSTEVPGGDE